MTEATPESVEVEPAEASTETPESVEVPTRKPLPDAPAGSEKQILADLKRERLARQVAEAKVKEFEDSNKSEAEKAAARAEAAEKRANEAEAKALRLEIADELKVPAHLRKFLTETDEDALREQATDLLASLEAAMAESGPRQPKPDPSQGAKPNSGPDLDRQIAEALAAGDVAKSIALKRQKAYAPTT